MKLKEFLPALAIAAVLPAAIGCEAVFTTSLASWAARDPSTLSKDQQISYAEDALASGDRGAMEDAYDALKDVSDNDIKPLVAELALGAAGVTEAMTTALADLLDGSTPADFEAAINGILGGFSSGELQLILEASALMQEAEAGGADISADQYLVMGVGVLIHEVISSGKTVDMIVASDVPLGLAFLDSAITAFGPASEAASIVQDLYDAFHT